MLQEYQVDRVLGAGGFGLTYLGWDTALDKAVAVKEYLPNDLAVREANHSVAAKFLCTIDWVLAVGEGH